MVRWPNRAMGEREQGLRVSVSDERGRPLRATGLALWLRRVAPRRARGAVSIALVSDRRKREALLRQIQQLLHERVRFGPIWDYVWPSGVGPRVEEPALMLINPYPWSAPLEEVQLRRN